MTTILYKIFMTKHLKLSSTTSRGVEESKLIAYPYAPLLG